MLFSQCQGMFSDDSVNKLQKPTCSKERPLLLRVPVLRIETGSNAEQGCNRILDLKKQKKGG